MKKFILFLFFCLYVIPMFSFAEILDVPFISQVLPGDWNNTLNCGQTSYYMADKFLSGDINLSSEDIKDIDDFLFDKFSDPIRDYNGYYTNTKKIKSIAEDFGGYENVFINKSSNDLDLIKDEIKSGNLIIPLVRISMKLDKDGHFMLLTGFDDEYVYFNDPGKIFGKDKKYKIDDFLDVWKSQNYNYLILRKKNTNNVEVKNDFIRLDKVSKNENNISDLSLKTINTNSVIYAPTSSSSSELLQSFVEVSNKINEENKKADEVVSENLNNDSGIIDNNSVTNESFGYGYGYGYGTEENLGGGSDGVRLPDFDFKNKYESGRLVIPMEFNFTNVTVDVSKYYFSMDYKINKDGEWENLFKNYTSNNFKYYVKTNDDTYYFRLKVCNLDGYCSSYKQISQKVYLEPATDKAIIGYDGEDVVMDRDEYFNVCFDIEPDQIVLITKGTKVKLSPGCVITVNGFLFAMGDVDDKISITSLNNTQQYYWAYIKFENSFGSILNNVDVSYGGYYYSKGYTYPQFLIDNSIVALDEVNFSNSMGQGAIYIQNHSAFYMVNSSVSNMKFAPGVVIKDSIGVLDNNIFDNNLYGIALYNVDSSLKIIGNKISNSYYYPIYGENIFAQIKDNVMVANKYNLIFQDINLVDGGEYNINKDVYELRNVYLGTNSILNIEAGTVFKFEKGNGNFNISGKLNVVGDSENPIVFTSISDDEYGGDVDNGSNRKPVIGDWVGFHINNNSKGVVFDKCVFRYGGSTDLNNFGVVNITNSSNVSIINSYISDNYYGINISNSNNININNCNIKNNFYGLMTEAVVDSNISNNYFNGNIVDSIVK